MSVQRPSPKFGWNGEPELEPEFKFAIGDLVAHRDDLKNYGNVVMRSNERGYNCYRVRVAILAPGAYAGQTLAFAEEVLVRIDPTSPAHDPQVLKS